MSKPLTIGDMLKACDKARGRMKSIDSSAIEIAMKNSGNGADTAKLDMKTVENIARIYWEQVA